MKRESTEAVLGRFKTKRVDLRALPSIDEQRAFVRDTASHQNKDECDTGDAEED